MSRHSGLRRTLFLGGWLLFCSRPAAAQDQFAERLQSAKEKSQRGSYSEAMADLESAILLEPTNPEGWYQLGLLRGEMGDFPGAETAFRRAIQLKPESPQAHFSLALTLVANPRNKLDWPGAIAELLEALKYDPEYAEARNLLGAGLTNRGDPAAAIPELQHALRRKPAFPEAHFNLAIALERTNRLEEAAAEYRAAVKEKGNYAEASSALGKLKLRMGKPFEAEQELTKALCLNPDLGDAHYALARVLLTVEKRKEAAVEQDTAKDLSQREQEAMQSALLSNQSLELASKGDLPGAVDAARRAITLKSDYGVPHYNLGLILADQGDLSGATHELAKAISLMPGQARPWFSLGRVLRRQGEVAGALESVSRAARMAPSDQAIRAELDSLKEQANYLKDRSKDLVATTQPKVGAASDTAKEHLAYARDLHRQKDLQGEAGELLRALALQPADLNARQCLAAAYQELGNYDRARLEYYKLIRIAPGDAGTHLALGKVLLQMDKVEDAKDQLSEVLKLEPSSREAKAALADAMRRSRQGVK